MTDKERTCEQAKVMLAFVNGKEIEVREGREEWLLTKNPCWDWFSYDYRVKKERATIDWSHVGHNLKYLFKSYTCGWVLSDLPPVANASGLRGGPISFLTFARNFASFKPVDCESADSLVIRPEGV